MTINREIVVERIIPTDDWSTYKDSRRLDVTNSSDVNPDAPNRGRVVFVRRVVPQGNALERGPLVQHCCWRDHPRVGVLLRLSRENRSQP